MRQVIVQNDVTVVKLGRKAETNVTEVTFDLSELITEFGDTTVTYKADIQEYIKKMIAEATNS